METKDPIIEKVEKLKEEAKQNPTKSKKCHSCKKKKTEIKELEPIIQTEVIPNIDEIKLAYYELTNMKGVNEEKKPFISDVYRFIFNEELDYACNVCVSTQARKFHNYLTKTLKLRV